MKPGRFLLPAALLLAGCARDDTPAPASVGSRAPAYQALSVSGDSTSLDRYRGQAVLLNVWATWCEPCQDEMPALEVAHRDFGPRGLSVVAVSIDQRAGDAAVRRFVDERGLTFTILRDPDDRVSRVFRLTGVPSTVLIDRNGVIAHRWIGPFDPTSPENRARLGKALTEPA